MPWGVISLCVNVVSTYYPWNSLEYIIFHHPPTASPLRLKRCYRRQNTRQPSANSCWGVWIVMKSRYHWMWLQHISSPIHGTLRLLDYTPSNSSLNKDCLQSRISSCKLLDFGNEDIFNLWEDCKCAHQKSWTQVCQPPASVSRASKCDATRWFLQQWYLGRRWFSFEHEYIRGRPSIWWRLYYSETSEDLEYMYGLAARIILNEFDLPTYLLHFSII